MQFALRPGCEVSEGWLLASCKAFNFSPPSLDDSSQPKSRTQGRPTKSSWETRRVQKPTDLAAGDSIRSPRALPKASQGADATRSR